MVGSGAMGTLCALILAGKGIETRLWGASPDHVATLARDRENRRHLPGHPFPAGIKPVHDPTETFEGAEFIISAVPCQFLDSVWKRLATAVPKDTPIVSTTKGIEIGSLRLPTTVLRDCVGDRALACLSGPNIAPEIADRKPAGTVIASADEALARRVQEAMATTYFRAYTSTDMLGVELGGAVKNVIAIAAGICDGIGAGDNAKAALLTRGLVEIARLGVAMGARAETFSGLAGLGDLFTTCVSGIGRNRTAGERIGRGESADHVVSSTSSVIEGIPTARSVLELARRHDVELPIVSAVASVLFDGASPETAIHALMTRRLGPEQRDP